MLFSLVEFLLQIIRSANYWGPLCVRHIIIFPSRSLITLYFSNESNIKYLVTQAWNHISEADYQPYKEKRKRGLKLETMTKCSMPKTPRSSTLLWFHFLSDILSHAFFFSESRQHHRVRTLPPWSDKFAFESSLPHETRCGTWQVFKTYLSLSFFSELEIIIPTQGCCRERMR